ncbi:MAG: hypothetical protein H7Z38_21605 [Rubrivivax sp.]|nr:hypothetical protein [Pyrinomonadaceae bacterium]
MRQHRSKPTSAVESPRQTTAQIIQFKPRPASADFPPLDMGREVTLPDFKLMPGIFAARVNDEGGGDGLDDILAGDTLVCQRDDAAEPGEIVIVQTLAGKLLVKRYDSRGIGSGRRIVGRALYLSRFFGAPADKEEA